MVVLFYNHNHLLYGWIYSLLFFVKIQEKDNYLSFFAKNNEDFLIQGILAWNI